MKRVVAEHEVTHDYPILFRGSGVDIPLGLRYAIFKLIAYIFSQTLCTLALNFDNSGCRAHKWFR